MVSHPPGPVKKTTEAEDALEYTPVFPPRTINLNQGLARPIEPLAARAMADAIAGCLPGSEASEAILEAARARVAALVGALPDEIIFTSGATEANNLAIKGSGLVAEDEILVAETEHLSVLHPARALGGQGVRVEWIGVDRDGRVDPDEVRRRIGPRTRLVAVMAANNETGAVQPVAEIGAVCRSAGARFLVDAATAAGVMAIDAAAWGADFISISARKIGGAAGAGALYARRETRLLPLIEGGVQEGGRRAGAQNLIGIAGLGAAATLAAEGIEARSARLRRLRDRLWGEIQERIPDAVRHGHPDRSLPGHLCVSIPGAEGEALALGLRVRGVEASTGSDCAAHAGKPSHVLLAMGAGVDLARSSLAFVVGEELSEDDISRAASAVAEVTARLRALAGGEEARVHPMERWGASQRSGTTP
jgi:cysteine desulfurase